DHRFVHRGELELDFGEAAMDEADVRGGLRGGGPVTEAPGVDVASGAARDARRERHVQRRAPGRRAGPDGDAERAGGLGRGETLVVVLAPDERQGYAGQD